MVTRQVADEENIQLECWQLTRQFPHDSCPPGAVLTTATTNPERATNRSRVEWNL